MAEPNIFVVDPAKPSVVTGVVSDDFAAPESEPQPADEALTDAPPLKAAPRPRKD